MSWDGNQAVFAARGSANEPLAVYQMAVDGSSCGKVADIDRNFRNARTVMVQAAAVQEES